MSDSTYQIHLAGSDINFVCRADDTILRSALRAGIPFPYECNVGACGNCKFGLTEGSVNMQWSGAPGWTEKDRQKGRYLGCQASPTSDCAVNVRTAEQYAPIHLPARLTGTLVGRRVVTHDIEEFHFRLEHEMRFEPGQYALLHMAGVTGARAYSMSNVADGSRVLHFQVRRVPDGRGTAVLFEKLRIGTSVEIDGPYGMAYLRRDVLRDILCIAGGSGLAPMISIARGAMAEPTLADVQLHFLYGARTPSDICGNDLLEILPGWKKRLHFEAAVSTPLADAMPSWKGHRGFVHDMAKERFGTKLAEMEIYFAGPPAMGSAVQRMLAELKVPNHHVHFDQFY